MKKVCLFDLNGTLVDTANLDPFFKYAFGSSDLRRVWFATALHATLVQTLTDRYHEFSEIAEATVVEMAEEAGFKLTPEQLDEFEFALNSMPVFADVIPGLQLLKSEGYTLAILSNSSRVWIEDLLSFDDVLDLFDRVFGTDAVRRYKPATEVYHMASDELGVLPHRVWMISAHAWDTSGAARAGLRSALITRPGHGRTKFDHKPDVEGLTLGEVAQAIIQKDHTLLKHVSDWV